ncbi:MAG TPA: acetate kinase [Clostridiales bacterium]|nr:acetate kinase [Clostridiales bacterium]
MKVLVINAGSSSLKYQLIDMTNEKVLAKGLAERIGIEGSMLTHQVYNKEGEFKIEKPMKDHTAAMELVSKALLDEEYGVIKSMDEVYAVGHRVLHGGRHFSQSMVINDEVMDAIRENIVLGPLHNPANIMGIEACQRLMPGKPNVSVFDTAFHQTMPEHAYIYALPYEMYEKYGIRKYGFHGTSHKYVSLRAAEILDKPLKELKIITCHLGNGSSIAAVKYGKVVDTSMGLTPLEGLPMGTRSGDIDPAVVTFLMQKENMTAEEMDNYLNKKSGVLGISGVSSDFRDLAQAASEGNKRAKLALDIFVYRVKKYIGAYAAAMGGVDVIVFTAGIGENTPDIRSNSCAGLEFLGVKIDEDKNNTKGQEMDISAPDSKVKVLVIPTNEELMIARETMELVGE